jgi:dihydroorotate dehydrogenase electron transfer subunit
MVGFWRCGFLSRGGLPGSGQRCDPGSFIAPGSRGNLIQTARVASCTAICREHFRLTLSISGFPAASAGQFVHLCPAAAPIREDAQSESHSPGVIDLKIPMLRRAYSIAGLRRISGKVEIDVIFRVVGTATRWMETLHAGDTLSLLGPLGNAFPISDSKPTAWLIAGGVGLPPMLWLAEALAAAGKKVVAFCGAQRKDLLALTIDDQTKLDKSAKSPALAAGEFAAWRTPVVVSTDDGSLGFHGYVPSAMRAHFAAVPPDPASLVVYTCGPEPMMHAVADFAVSRNIEAYLCMERNMACGTGMCQSCVVPVADSADPDGWSYKLCCTDGPIFSAETILWQLPARR